MAEVLLKIGQNEQFADGDILCAFSNEHILDVHAQHICHPAKFGFNDDGLRDFDTPMEMYLKATSQYMFNRASKTEVRRTNLATGTVSIIGPKPNKEGEYMDVELFIRRRRGQRDHLVFGETGKERWYGGRITVTPLVVTDVWDEIEERDKKKKRKDHRLWPLTDIEKRHFLGLSTASFNDDEAAEMTAPVLGPEEMIEKKVDGKTVQLKHQPIIAKRKNAIDYPAIAIVKPVLADVLDMETAVDIRNPDANLLKHSDAVMSKA